MLDAVEKLICTNWNNFKIYAYNSKCNAHRKPIQIAVNLQVSSLIG